MENKTDLDQLKAQHQALAEQIAQAEAAEADKARIKAAAKDEVIQSLESARVLQIGRAKERHEQELRDIDNVYDHLLAKAKDEAQLQNDGALDNTMAAFAGATLRQVLRNNKARESFCNTS